MRLTISTTRKDNFGMTILDIHGQSKRFANEIGQTVIARNAARTSAVRFLALFETILENPLLPAFLCGVVFHVIRLILYVALNGKISGFLPVHPIHYLAWLPEFALPYAALKLIAAGHRKTSESMH